MSNELDYSLQVFETQKLCIRNMYSSTFMPLKPAVAAKAKQTLFSLRKSKVLTTTSPKTGMTMPTVSCVSSKESTDPLIALQVQQVIERQSKGLTQRRQTSFDQGLLKQAYKNCQKICADNATSYYIGSLLMTEERKKAIWAIYAWGRRTDELVDGPNADHSPEVLDRWEGRLEDIFNGKPYDLVDTALADTVQRFPLDIKPFKDMIKGMRMDTWKTRYQNFEELELYSYYVAGTVGLMALPVMGISPEYHTSTENVYKAALSFGIANQLTNILRDVAEDAILGRIYLPQDELTEFGLTDKDIYSKNVSERWRQFTKKQVARARSYYKQAEEGTAQLDRASRWPVWAASMLYQKILDEIEHNNYDNLTKKARVGSAKKLLTLPVAYAKAMT